MFHMEPTCSKCPRPRRNGGRYCLPCHARAEMLRRQRAALLPWQKAMLKQMFDKHGNLRGHVVMVPSSRRGVMAVFRAAQKMLQRKGQPT